MAERKAFNFYNSYYKVYMELDNENKVLFMDALLNKQFCDIEPNLTGMAKFAYLSQQHSITSQVEGYKSKTKSELNTPTKGGSEGGIKGGSVQGKEKGKEKGQLIEEFINKDHEQLFMKLSIDPSLMDKYLNEFEGKLIATDEELKDLGGWFYNWLKLQPKQNNECSKTHSWIECNTLVKGTLAQYEDIKTQRPNLDIHSLKEL